MSNVETAAFSFCIITTVVILFQLALSLGAPWGEMAMGGKFPGRYPISLRIAALFQAILLIIAILIVLTKAGVIYKPLYEFSKSAIWYVFALCVATTILNIITPSKKERALWAPVAIILVICSYIVANT